MRQFLCSDNPICQIFVHSSEVHVPSRKDSSISLHAISRSLHAISSSPLQRLHYLDSIHSIDKFSRLMLLSCIATLAQISPSWTPALCISSLRPWIQYISLGHHLISFVSHWKTLCHFCLFSFLLFSLFQISFLDLSKFPFWISYIFFFRNTER